MASKRVGIFEMLMKRVFKVEDLVYVLDENENLVCLTYALEAFRPILFEYLEKHQLDVKTLKIDTMTTNKKEDEYPQMIQFKIVTLDDELVLFKDVMEKAKTHVVEGYDEKTPKFGMNTYKTVK